MKGCIQFKWQWPLIVADWLLLFCILNDGAGKQLKVLNGGGGMKEEDQSRESQLKLNGYRRLILRFTYCHSDQSIFLITKFPVHGALTTVKDDKEGGPQYWILEMFRVPTENEDEIAIDLNAK